MQKKVIVITGGAGGLGKSTSLKLKEYTLVITDYAQESVDKAVKKLTAAGIDAVGIAADITDKAPVEKLKTFAERQGEFKGIVHTAGVSGTIGDPEKVFEINLKATDIVVDTFYDLAHEGAVVVLFASMMGHSIPPNEEYDNALRKPQEEGAYSTIKPFINNNADTMYNFSKRGVMLICKDNAMRFGKKGTRIVTVSPGVIMTAMAQKALIEHPETMQQTLNITPLGRYGEPEDIAKVVKFLISDDASFITGTDVAIDGGVLTQII